MRETANVLNKLPKGMQPKAKDRLHEIWTASTRKGAVGSFDAFVQDFGATYEAAVMRQIEDRDELLTFYDFPAEHWRHLRTTNPIESTFSMVRLRHRRTTGNGSREACLAMVFKLAQSAERRWRQVNSNELITHINLGVRFTDGTLDKFAA